MDEKTFIITIIMPVFNAEKTIHLSLNSLIDQRISDVQLVIVNDCSNDNSLSVIHNYKQLFVQKGWAFECVSHECNKGVASARNTGLNWALGKYICYLDADDYLEPEALLDFSKYLKNDSVDILGFNWCLSFVKNKRLMKQPSFENAWDAIELMLKGKMRWNLWLFIVKRELYEENKIRFIDGLNMGEDLYAMVNLFIAAKKVQHIGGYYYNYNQMNSASLTKVYSDRHISEVTENIHHLELALLSSIYKEKVGHLIDNLKLNIKLPLLISGSSINYIKWYKWFPESNYLISKKNNGFSYRINFIQKAALWKKYWIVKAYYFFIVRLLYGVIYR